YTSSFAESTINEVVARRFCKKQQMQWTKKGAHSMLSARTKVLNGELGDCFKKWYPNIKIEKNYNEAA
ncbi:MAG TPA: ISKra4 family transposase, partial [Pricia sp.]|nr:ISKra4 family transposase [Pricia sp.]HZJ20810.1 ISKra4 family transposase [Pricia sp.]